MKYITYEDFKNKNISHGQLLEIKSKFGTFESICIEVDGTSYLLFEHKLGEYSGTWETSEYVDGFFSDFIELIDFQQWCQGWAIGSDLVNLSITSIEVKETDYLERGIIRNYMSKYGLK